VRILLYTGKGGVGKTSVSAATAMRLARQGYRTVVLSTDAAHSLGDSLDTPLGPEPREIMPNLWAHEVEVLHEMDEHWTTLQTYMNTLLSSQGLDSVVAEEMTVLPGAEELAGLVRIVNHYDSGKFDVVVVDCAPTGETLRLLSFPDAARWWLQKIFPIQRKMARLLRPVGRMVMPDVPMPQDNIFDAVERLLTQIDRIHALLIDPQMTSVRIVLNPEKMVVKEAQRVFTYLNLFGYATDMVVCNRVLPAEVHDAYFAGWKQSQERYHRLVIEGFSPLPVLDVPLFDQEVVGFEMLERMAEAIYGERDPNTVFFTGKTEEIEPQGDGYLLRLPMPFAEKGAVEMTQVGDELIVQVGSYKRNMILPRALATMRAAGAKLDGGELRVTFRPYAPAVAGGKRGAQRGRRKAVSSPGPRRVGAAPHPLDNWGSILYS
jgi:arsenite/tail-anchored protein-transporting ATPase